VFDIIAEKGVPNGAGAILLNPAPESEADTIDLLAQQDLTQSAFRIVDNTTAIVEHHRLAANRIAGSQGQSGLAGIAGSGEIHPCGGHLFRQSLCVGRVARALFAALRVIETRVSTPNPGQFSAASLAPISSAERLGSRRLDLKLRLMW
jgi:hypothetical protein